jgi:hypothetical protein
MSHFLSSETQSVYSLSIPMDKLVMLTGVVHREKSHPKESGRDYYSYYIRLKPFDVVSQGLSENKQISFIVTKVSDIPKGQIRKRVSH